MDFDTSMTLDAEANTARIVLVGELDSATAPSLDELIHTAARYPLSELVLDMAGVSYMSSAGLRCLVYAHHTVGRTARIVLVGTRPAVVDVIEMTGFDQTVVLQDSQET